MNAGNSLYPTDAAIQAMLAAVTDQTHWLNGQAVAAELGNTKMANVVILGPLGAAKNRRRTVAEDYPQPCTGQIRRVESAGL